MKNLRKICLTALVPAALASRGLAEPVITGVSGPFREGGSATVTGAGFGSSGPDLIFFDDFEGGTAGQPLRTGPGSARVGAWSGLEGEVVYSSASRVSGSLAFRADMALGWINYGEIALPVPTTEVFYSWWKFIPEDDRWPGEGNVDGVNWKNMWIMRSGTTDNDLWTPALQDGGASWVLGGNDTGSFGVGDSLWMNRVEETQDDKGRWHRNWIWLKGDPSQSGGGALRYWVLRADGVHLANTKDQANLVRAGGAWHRLRVNGYGRQTPDCHPMFDDVYVAAGPAARARVEIGNRATYDESTNLAISSPTSWSDAQIIFTFRRGSFADGSAGYLYVVDANGVINGTGFPVTVGDASDATPPAAPRGLGVQ